MTDTENTITGTQTEDTIAGSTVESQENGAVSSDVPSATIRDAVITPVDPNHENFFEREVSRTVDDLQAAINFLVDEVRALRGRL